MEFSTPFFRFHTELIVAYGIHAGLRFQAVPKRHGEHFPLVGREFHGSGEKR